MSLNTHAVTKLYWQTRELTKILNVTAATIRYWAKEFCIQVRETGGNRDWQRRYWSAQNVEDLKLIHHLLKVKGMTTSGAMKVFSERGENLKHVGVPLHIVPR